MWILRSRLPAIRDGWTSCAALCARAWQPRQCATRGPSPAKWKLRFAPCGSSGVRFDVVDGARIALHAGQRRTRKKNCNYGCFQIRKQKRTSTSVIIPVQRASRELVFERDSLDLYLEQAMAEAFGQRKPRRRRIRSGF